MRASVTLLIGTIWLAGCDTPARSGYEPSTSSAAAVIAAHPEYTKNCQPGETTEQCFVRERQAAWEADYESRHRQEFTARKPANCDEASNAVKTAALQLKTKQFRLETQIRYGRLPSSYSEVDAAVGQMWGEYRRTVEGALAVCRKGDLMILPSEYVKDYCDFNKAIVKDDSVVLGSMTTCVRR